MLQDIQKIMRLLYKRYSNLYYYGMYLLIWMLPFGLLGQNVKNKRNIQEYIEQGEAEWEVSNYKESLVWFTKALKIDSTSGEIYFKRAKSYLFIQDYRQAQKDLQKADSLGYRQKETPFYWGVICFQQNEYEKAIEHFEKALKIDFQEESFYVYVAETYRKLGKNELASQFYEKAILQNPNQVDAYLLRASFFLEQEDYTKALGDLEKVTQLQPRHWAAYKQKADIYFGQNKDAESIKNRLLYFKYVPDKQKIVSADYSSLAFSYAQTKQFAKAVETISKAIELEKENPEYYFERATYYIQLKNYAKALTDCQKAIELDGEDIVYFRQRAFLYRMLKKYEEALQDYIFLAQQDEKDAENHYFVAEMKFYLKQEPKLYQNDVQTAFQLGYPKENMHSELQKYAERKLGFAKFFRKKVKS